MSGDEWPSHLTFKAGLPGLDVCGAEGPSKLQHPNPGGPRGWALLGWTSVGMGWSFTF